MPRSDTIRLNRGLKNRFSDSEPDVRINRNDCGLWIYGCALGPLLVVRRTRAS
jgi:hypothetical protein